VIFLTDDNKLTVNNNASHISDVFRRIMQLGLSIHVTLVFPSGLANEKGSIDNIIS